MVLYCENQRGGLCRMHSLNHFFERHELSPAKFNKLMTEYDAHYKKMYGVESSCKNWDIVESNQKNIIGFILKKYNIYTRYFAINQFDANHDDFNKIIAKMQGNIFFIFNENHIWNIGRENGQWFTINSIGGVRPLNILQLNMKNCGFIFPVYPGAEFNRNVLILKKIFGKSSRDEIAKYLTHQWNEKKMLGDVEVPLGAAMDIMRSVAYEKVKNKTFDARFARIAAAITDYDDFLTHYKNKYCLLTVLKFLPDVLFDLTQHLF